MWKCMPNYWKIGWQNFYHLWCNKTRFCARLSGPWCYLMERPSLLLALIEEKSFDRIHWGYLSRVLDKFGISSQIHSAILAFYFYPSAFVFVKGILSKAFNISNGTCQGYPLSPLIFALLMEPLVEKIGTHPGIQGMISKGWQHTITLFVDDLKLSLSDPVHSLPVVYDILDQFNKVSYYKIDALKSNILGLGVNHATKLMLKTGFPFQCVPNYLQYLGIRLTASTADLYKTHFLPLITEVQ